MRQCNLLPHLQISSATDPTGLEFEPQLGPLVEKYQAAISHSVYLQLESKHTTELQHLHKSEYQDADHTEPQFLALLDSERTSSLGYNQHPQNFGASYNKTIIILYHDLR